MAYFFTIIFTLFVLFVSSEHPTGGNHVIYLPMVTTPAVLTPSQEVTVQITPEGGLFSSTFEPHSFVITSSPENSETITVLSIDLSTTSFPDMVYDPNGIAGDHTAKNLEVDSNGGTVGFVGHSFTGPHDDGFDKLHIFFDDFDPGETFTFSLDVDPTSIRGVAAPGPVQSGSVSGLELVAATIEVTLSDSSTMSGQTYRIQNSLGGSEAIIRNDLPPAPQFEVMGIMGTTAVVTEANQTLEIQTFTRGLVKALVIEAGLFTEGVPNGGHDLDPFEANSALTAREYEHYSTGGTVTIPIQLSNTHSEGGRNIIVVVQQNDFGYTGTLSSPIVLDLQD